MTTAIVRTSLNYKNYNDWKSQIKTYLLAEDLWDIIDEGTDECPKTEEEKAQSKGWKKDAKALYAIQNSCGDDTYDLIKYKTTAKQAWDTLSKKLEKPGGPSNEKEYMSVGEAYQPEVLIEERRTPGAGLDEIQETFVKCVVSNDWDNAINFLRQHPQLGSAIVKWGGTALHYAIRKRCSVRRIQELVELMPMEHLEIPAAFGYTALYWLIRRFPERVEVAKCMAKKNPNLLTILPRWDKKALVAIAQANTRGERMARYIYSLTPPETIKVVDAAHLISHGFRLQRFDIAWDLIQCYPKLAMNTDHNGNIPLVALASNCFAFKSGSRLNLWEKLIYIGIRIKPLPPLDKEKHESDEGHLSDQKENQSHLISSGMGLFQRLVANLQKKFGISRIYQMKLVHERVQQFLPLMCKAVRKEDMNYYQERKLEEALCVATEQGHVEYITNFLRYSSYPVLKVGNQKFQSLFQIAAECRHYNVYNIICEFLRRPDKDGLDKSESGLHSDELKEEVEYVDNLGNNMLHTVAMITPLSQIDHIQGATLQMQRELQWFKEVKSIAEPKDCESVNKDNKTPRKVFKENHKELGKEAEKSMKETATACTVVGSLIITIMFAAAFTVPSENDKNDEKTDLPTFLTNKVFTIFIVSDAISLFSSTTSVIMFLGILTSRYSEDDFYKSLPTKMIIGLFTLFLSIATMMIVFSCGLYIMLEGKSSIVIPSILLASVPVTSFIWMQFPLLLELFISTFGQGVFDRKQKNLF
ncbi:hypothetical protein D8674_018497 [Pyrus ussuriensis x Pyrus communis]|uniref:PGG domain-containing protein n=1 Tax=Pyrus ussuriensis x Pyrus communis TaxID=2448454 RepID=A0A5N5G4Z0_9ROSA|nr:hypothetical protein D8674_018497 [Pyrus ussuriensis x Pyrus communis]